MTGSKAQLLRGAEAVLLSLILVLFVNSSRLRANDGGAEEPAENVPVASAPNAAPMPPDGTFPGPIDPSKTEHTLTSTTYQDSKGNTIEVHLHHRYTHKLILVHHNNWFYPNGMSGSVTVYHIETNGTITTTLTTYRPDGDVKSEEHWTTNANGIVSNSTSTMFPNGAKNSDPTYTELHAHEIGTIYTPLPGGGSTNGINPPAYETGSLHSGWYLGIYGGANIYQSYGSQKLQTTVGGGQGIVPGDLMKYDGGTGGLHLGYDFAPTQLWGLTVQPAVQGDVSWLGASSKQVTNDSQTGNKLNTIPIIFSGILQFPTPSNFTPYIGVGLGFDVFQMNSYERMPGFNGDYHLGSATAVAPALSEEVGVQYRFGPTSPWSVFTEFKMNEAFGTRFDVNNAGSRDFNYTVYDGVLSQGTITAGLNYKF
jgi:opacity protein-like surface antigen